MKKIKIIIVSLIVIGFLLMFLGFLLVLIGALKPNYDLVYYGIFGIISSTIIYTILIIYGLVYYFKHRR